LYIIVCPFVIFCWPLYCPFFFDLCLLITSLVYKNLLYTISWCNLCQWFVESVWFSSWALWFLQFSRYSGLKKKKIQEQLSESDAIQLYWKLYRFLDKNSLKLILRICNIYFVYGIFRKVLCNIYFHFNEFLSKNLYNFQYNWIASDSGNCSWIFFFFNLLIILSYGKIKKLWQTGGKGTYFIPITIKTGW
jgi:hypothetical protein